MAQMTVEVVGKQFVRKYYKMCSDEPENLYRFYQNESQLVYGEGSGEVEPVTGIEGIKSKINSRGCKGAEFNIASGTLDAQPTMNNGVMVMVTGTITKKDDQARQFVQSFFLAPQEKNPKSFFVLNDTFRIVETPAVVTYGVTVR